MGIRARGPSQKDGGTESENVSTPEAVASSPEPKELDKVREILFGAQAVEFDRRLSAVEQELRAQIREEISALERRVKHEVDAITERMNGEERERRSGDGDLLAKLVELSKTLEMRIAEFNKKSEQAQGALRDQLLSQSNLLSDAIQQRHDEATALMNDGLRDLREAKTDRGTLSSLLMDVAMRLKGEEESGAAQD